MIKLYLFDIEGTTTDINFVHKVLFPYSYERMEEYVLNHLFSDDVKKALELVYQTVHLEDKKNISVQDAIFYLKKWIKEDRKHPGLKLIQGLIWEFGYKNNDFQGHVYPDVEPFFQKIKAQQKQIGIYSSGSVQAQELLFGYSINGDLKSYISFYFDTKMGAKREKNSYLNIMKTTQFEAQQICFFSDILEELDAAKEAGFNTRHLQRETYQGLTSDHHIAIKNFSEFTL